MQYQTNGDSEGITAISMYKRAWEILKRSFPDLLFIVILMIIFQLPGLSIQETDEILNIWSTLYSILIAGPVSFVLYYAVLQVVRGERFRVEAALNMLRSNYLNIMLASLLYGAIIFVGLILFIIPGIIFAVRLAFVPYLVTDKNMEPLEAVKTSWDKTGPYAWQIFFLGLLAIVIIAAGVVLLVVGVIVSLMWISAASALLYHLVDRKNTMVIDNMR